MYARVTGTKLPGDQNNTDNEKGQSMPRFAANLSMMFTEVPFPTASTRRRGRVHRGGIFVSLRSIRRSGGER